ncbi:hypothetical protein EVG20_g3406 [Dentipellis fragilis]|uniref:Uncharacterized protein n=1 Tax=Dentipellis fragilis TaxID=205917 RepID=A0A4Y9Z2I0_9AGAM|nr:hypothetical protein EVG20_g3406 [Dentipellis fragilis]
MAHGAASQAGKKGHSAKHGRTIQTLLRYIMEGLRISAGPGDEGRWTATRVRNEEEVRRWQDAVVSAAIGL